MKRLLILFIFFFSYTSYSQTAEEYYNSGLKKSNKRDSKGAIADYTKAKKGLKWKPVSSFDNLVKKMVESDLKSIAN